LGYSFGGAIDSTGGTTLTINDSQFSGNTLNVGGGLDPNVDFSGMVGGAAILTADGTVTVNNSQFENNTAKAGDGLEGTGQSGGVAIGGAIAVFNGSFLGGYSQSDLHIAGSTFSENQAIGGAGADGSDGVRGGDGGPAYGGAINVSNGAAATIVQSEFVGNQAVSADGGHGGAGADGGHSGVYGPLFFSSAGGAISQVGSSLVVVDSSFSGNIVQGGNGGQGGAGGNGGNGSTNRGGALGFAPWGGAELNKVSLTNATITNNTAMAGNGGNAGDGGTNGSNGDASGAGFFSYSVSGRNDLMFIEITDSAITGNDAQAPAGSEISGSGDRKSVV
jgi:hypothetical protein